MIPRRTVEQILDATRIEEVVGDYVTLKRRGSNLIACCPFHNEKTPSFSVSPSKGIYKCFGCGKSGTAVSFLMEHNGLSYSEALKALAKKYNIEVVEKEETAEEIAQRQKDESILLVLEWAEKFFHQQLQTPEGGIGLAYYKSRGLEDATIDAFGLGWAPNGRNTLANAAKAAGFKEEYLVDANLCVRTENGSLVDRFYNRVSFPIRNINGRTIAFSCRTLSSDKTIAKYVNSSETEVYKKRFTLYGIDAAKVETRRQDKFILVEGQMDVITMHQLGITNVAASSGTSLTVEQVKMIKRFTDNVTIIYDGDSAGIHAALRGIGLVLQGGLNVKIVLLPDGDDPDSFGRTHTKDEVLEYIRTHEQDFIDFKSTFLLGEAGNDPLKKAGLVNEIGDTIALIPDPVKRSMYIPFAASKLGVEEYLLQGRVKKAIKGMIEERRKEKEREARLASGNEAPMPQEMPSLDEPPVEYYEAVPAETAPQKDKWLDPCEKELMTFILNNGCSKLEFQQDSPFYREDASFTVFDFISSVLFEDEAEFYNPDYRSVYNKYSELYQQGLTQDQISVRLLSSDEPRLVQTVRDIIIEKDQLTVKKFIGALTAETTALAMQVPKALLVYNKAKVEKELELITRTLRSASETEQAGLMARMMELNKLKTKLSKKLGRI